MVEKIVDLIRQTSASLPSDIIAALTRAHTLEEKGSSAEIILQTILDNCALAKEKSTPLCQDTGTLTFFVHFSLQNTITPSLIKEAVALATARGYLRKNCIDAITGESFDDNCTIGAPVIHYCSSSGVTLLMKGGGSENMSRQYSLPDTTLNAARDIAGIRACILDAVQKAQGYGCAPGILGVCIGGDRATGFEVAKEQLLRDITDSSDDEIIAKLEDDILSSANSLGIGPMGLGGKTTLLGVKIAKRPRVPASFFVTVAYMCWAARRRTIQL